MARSPFPTADFGRGVSPDLPGAAIGAAGAGAAGAVADAAQRFGARVRKMADTALEREGLADAARAVDLQRETGAAPVLRAGQGVDDLSYNAAVREQWGAQRQAAYADQLNQIETANPDSEARFLGAHRAMDAAFAPTGDADMDLAFNRFRTIENMQALTRVRRGQEAARRETVRGAYVESSTTAGTALGQAIASAGLDDDGAKLVGLALNQYAAQISRFGPREAFSVGGVDFPADGSRAGVVSPEKLAADFDRAQVEARMAWIISAGERTPGAMGKLAFAGQVQDRWAAGDPMFAGLGAAEMGQLVNRLEADASRAATDERAQLAAVTERARDTLKALEYGGEVDTGELRALARASGDAGLIAEVDYRLANGFRVSPRDNLPGGAGAAGAGFDGWVGFLMDSLEGSALVGNDNGRGRAQFGITEASHPEAWRDGRIDRTEAAAIYRRDYWNPIGGDALPPDLALAAASAAVIGGVGTAKELLAQAGGDVDRFLQLEEQRFRRLAASDPKYADDLNGWLGRIGKVRGQIALGRAGRRAAEGYATDPIGFARGSSTRPRLATIPEMAPGQLFDGDPAAVTAFLQGRRQVGQQLARDDGVTPRLFASEEVSIIKDRIEADPAAVLTLTQRAAAAIGPDGARAMLMELGETAGDVATQMRLGWLSLDRGGRGFAVKAVEGLALRASGQPAAKFDSGEGIADAARTFAAGLSARPDDLGPAIAVAEAAAVADEARGMRRPAAHYVQGALGRNPYNNRFYGGVSHYNGAQTLLPAWLRDDGLDEVVGWAAERWVRDGYGPVHGNGQPISASNLRGMRLRSMPDGRYRLVNPMTGQFVPGRQGSPFEFTLDGEATYEALRTAFPALVRPR